MSQLKSPLSYPRKETVSKKRSYSTRNNTSISHYYDLPTPSTPSTNHKRQKISTLPDTLISDSILIETVTTLESKVINLQDDYLTFEFQNLIEDGLQFLRGAKLPQKSFDEFYTPMTRTATTTTTSNESISMTTEIIYETPKDRIINNDKFTSPPRIPKLSYILQLRLDEIESTGLDL